MGYGELTLLACALAMDAFAVSICKGLSVSRLQVRHMVCAGAWFGAFQALMPAIGYLCGLRFQSLIASIDHWIAFVLLAAIGANMIRDSFGEAESCPDASCSPRAMLPLAVATSIDALAVGVTFAFLSVDIVPACVLIGVVTFVLSAVGVKVGELFGARFEQAAERTGGVVLLLIGLKILLEHLGVLG